MNPGLIPPADVAAAAKRGLELREKFHRGGTSVGVHRAKQLAERRDVSFRDITAISAYFARHEVDKASKSHASLTPPCLALDLSTGSDPA
jgi:hypothetical protein